MKWRLFKLKLRAWWLKFQIDHYDSLVTMAYRDWQNPNKFEPIPVELLSESAPPEYQELWDEYVLVFHDISELLKCKQQ